MERENQASRKRGAKRRQKREPGETKTSREGKRSAEACAKTRPQLPLPCVHGFDPSHASQNRPADGSMLGNLFQVSHHIQI